VKLTDVVRMAIPQILAAMRKRLPGTFTPPQAEIIAMATPVGKTALDALAFPDHGTAQANRPGRSAAPAVFNTIGFANPAEILVTGSTVTGRMLSSNLAARQPHDFPERLVSSTRGVDICPR
jgi:hypothetical protein